MLVVIDRSVALHRADRALSDIALLKQTDRPSCRPFSTTHDGRSSSIFQIREMQKTFHARL
ncbi:hypothetical protein LPH45_00900 [Xylella taiwanensis]|uniref:hypothetical protein n=1 Tax=Xylella taiwanensis TaxID=1444770 RepID=UPI0004B5FBEB|nr:hypothetical protein [Xylella taiwanensis]UFN09272.1 hypothetical protein LPH45_00900 [Xylella taiwanensis]UFN19630.1 hypothetical protein LPH58_07235 [Xylella taiwanensis]